MSSRTSTAEWKRLRKQAIGEAVERGLTNCPICGVWLDYERAQRPNSAEVDHVIPFALTGSNEGVLRVICRLDNQRLGAVVGAQRRRQRRVVPTIDYRD